MDTSSVLRIVLVVFFVALSGVAWLYLSTRKLPRLGYLTWGLLAALPLIGPFLVLFLRPGQKLERTPGGAPQAAPRTSAHTPPPASAQRAFPAEMPFQVKERE